MAECSTDLGRRIMLTIPASLKRQWDWHIMEATKIKFCHKNMNRKDGQVMQTSYPISE
jgi:hypothetical protein